MAGDSQAPALPCSRAHSRDNFTNPSASNFFLFSMICRESTESHYPWGSCLPHNCSREVVGCKIHPG